MKRIVTVTEVEGEGLESFLGKPIMLMCMNYNYSGTLEGVNESFVKLSADDAVIVYETGEWSKPKWADAQKVGGAIYVERSKIEAFFGGKA
jgi:hypothetical protein